MSRQDPSYLSTLKVFDLSDLPSIDLLLERTHFSYYITLCLILIIIVAGSISLFRKGYFKLVLGLAFASLLSGFITSYVHYSLFWDHVSHYSEDFKFVSIEFVSIAAGNFTFVPLGSGLFGLVLGLSFALFSYLFEGIRETTASPRET
jgi:general stress protein CsbA